MKNSVYLFCIMYFKRRDYWTSIGSRVYSKFKQYRVDSQSQYVDKVRGEARIVIITLPHPVSNGTVEPQVAAPLKLFNLTNWGGGMSSDGGLVIVLTPNWESSKRRARARWRSGCGANLLLTRLSR